MATTVVFAGGPVSSTSVRRALEGAEPDRTIAADSGLVACRVAGLLPDVVIGDMDSVPSEMLGVARARGTRIEVRSRDKDATDLELALDLALDLAADDPPEGDDPHRVLVIGSDGGRLDHLLAVVGLLGSPRYADVEVSAWLGEARVVPVHRSCRISAGEGRTVTLLALHGPVSGVTTEGLRWHLSDGHLDANRTLGVSNVCIGEDFAVEVASGVVTVVLPGPERSGAGHGAFGREAASDTEGAAHDEQSTRSTDAPDVRREANGPRHGRRDRAGRRVLWQR